MATRSLPWQAAAYAAGLFLRAVPRRLRFSLSLRLANAAAPLVRRTKFYRERPCRHDGPYEESLRLTLRAMTRLGVTFDPQMVIEGAELLPEGPALLATAHVSSNMLVPRLLHDRGFRVSFLTWRPEPGATLMGSEELLDAVDTTDPRVFLLTRTRLREGRQVVMMPEAPAPFPGAIEMAASSGTSYVSDAVFHLAERLRVPMIFYATRFDGRRVHLTVVRPSANDSATMTREFCDFFVAQTRRTAP